jgi:hypothetical protein
VAAICRSHLNRSFLPSGHVEAPLSVWIRGRMVTSDWSGRRIRKSGKLSKEVWQTAIELFEPFVGYWYVAGTNDRGLTTISQTLDDTSVKINLRDHDQRDILQINYRRIFSKSNGWTIGQLADLTVARWELA